MPSIPQNFQIITLSENSLVIFLTLNRSDSSILSTNIILGYPLMSMFFHNTIFGFKNLSYLRDIKHALESSEQQLRFTRLFSFCLFI